MLGISPDRYATDFTHGVIVAAMRGRRPSEPIKHFPNRLREWRTARGYSLLRLAELTGQKHQSVARHETGLNQITLVQMETYAKALNIKPEELLNDSVRINPKLRELLDILENLPATEQERLVNMTRAFAEPRAAFVPSPVVSEPKPAVARNTRASRRT